MITYQHAITTFRYDQTIGRLLRISTGQPVGTVIFNKGRIHCRRVVISEHRCGSIRLKRTENEANIIWLLMTGKWPKHDIDHADLNPLNNKWGNLREADDQQQAFNRRKTGNSPFKWVQEVDGSLGPRYRGRVAIGGKRVCTPYFNTPQQAHAAALVIARKLHGPFVRAV